MDSKRTSPDFATPPAITREMIDAGCEQSRMDSHLNLSSRDRIERVLRAALSGKPNRALLDQSLQNTCL